LADLACDADNLAEGLRLLARTGHAVALAPVLAAALALAFDEGALPDGSFATFLVPHTGGEWVTRQATAVRDTWGGGADPEVVANLMHAAGTYSPQRYRAQLDRGAGYLLGAQARDGSWPSGRRGGPLHGTYQAMRALALLAPDAARDALARAQQYVLASQNDDGGWAATGGASDALGTALALLILAQASQPHLGQSSGLPGTADGEHAAHRAREWLAGNARADDAYPAEPLTIMTPRRCPGLGHEVQFSCRSITTALVCQAAVTWDRLS
jgi:squalene cyclase